MLYQEKVKLNEKDHSYYDENGLRYMGFSSFYNEFLHRKFDAEFMAGRVASASEGEKSKQDVLDEWQKANDMGCYYDKAIEECVDPIFYPKYCDIEETVRSILSEYEPYKGAHCQQKVVYNEYYRIAGSPDKFCLTSNRKDSSFIMSDFKVFEKDDLYVGRGWLNEPFNHLPASKFIKIAFQLSYYAFQLEHLLEGKKPKELFIHLISHNSKTHRKIHVPYLRNDIQLALELNKDKIINLLNVKQQQEESLF